MEQQRLKMFAMAEARRANRSFRVPYLGNASVELRRQMVEMRAAVRRIYHYSVYGAVIQSSGLGKSRAVVQMSKLDGPDAVYICYCSMAAAHSTSFPPRTGLLADKMQAATLPSEKDIVFYLKAWLLVLERTLAENPGLSAANWMEAQLPPENAAVIGTWSSNIATLVRQEWDRLCSEDDPMEEDVGEKNEMADPECAEEEMDGDIDKQNEKLIMGAIRGVTKHISGTARVVFVFDEALGLHEFPGFPAGSRVHHSPFYELRRALRVFFKHQTFFALVLDTAAKLSNLLPTWSLERSDRALKPGVGVLWPIYYIPNLQLKKPLPGKSLQHYANPQIWMQYGRPMWSARLGGDRSLENLVDFASQKLVGTTCGQFLGAPVDIADGKMVDSQAMALLSAGVGLDICPRSSLAQLMAASHMNLVLRVSKDRQRIYVGLPVEPILAEAAARLMDTDTVKLPVLKVMEQSCMAGYVTPGPRGEFVARFILLAAMWDLKAGHDWHLQLVSVDEYLERLLVTGRSDKPTFRRMKNVRASWSKSPDNGYVFFNSYMTVKRAPDSAMLGRCFAAGKAIMYHAENNLPGADLIIPVWTPSGMTAIVVSVENLARPGWLEDVSVRKMKSEYTEIDVKEGLPVYTIVMSLREPSASRGEVWNWILWDESKDSSPIDTHVHMTCYGIDNNYSFLSKEVKTQLKYILFTVPDALADATDKQREWIRNMIPEAFEEPDASYADIAVAVDVG